MKKEEILKIIREKPLCLLNKEFQNNIKKIPRNEILSIIKDTGINHNLYGITFTDTIVYEDKSYDEVITFLNEKCNNEQLQERVYYVLSYINEKNNSDLMNILLNSLDEHHLLIKYITQEYQPIFKIEFINKLINNDIILNSEYIKKNRDKLPWTESFVLDNLYRLNPNNIPKNLRTNRVLSHIIYGKETNVFLPLNDIYTPIEDDDFPIPDDDDFDSWENTINTLMERNNNLKKDASQDEIMDYFKNNPVEFIRKARSNNSFCKMFLNTEIIMNIIRLNPQLSIYLPIKYMSIRKYAMAVKFDNKLIDKIPHIIRFNPEFINLIK